MLYHRHTLCAYSRYKARHFKTKIPKDNFFINTPIFTNTNLHTHKNYLQKIREKSNNTTITTGYVCLHVRVWYPDLAWRCGLFHE